PPRSQTLFGNDCLRNSVSRPRDDSKQSFETCVPKQSLGTRSNCRRKPSDTWFTFRARLAERARNVNSSYLPPGGTCFFSQAKTSLCQYSLFFGFSTQWPSSGKLISRDSTPCRCSAVNNSCPWPTGQRKSRSFWMSSIGVLNLPRFAAFLCGE